MDKIRNDYKRRELEVMPISNKTENYRRNWKDILERMEYDSIPKATLNYNPSGKRDRGRPRQRWIKAGIGL